MQKTIAAMLLAIPMMAHASKPNPNDYKLQVHVRQTELTYACNSSFLGNPSSCGMRLLVIAIVEGKKLELRANTSVLLRTGDYKAKPAALGDDTSYEDYRGYEFLMPDGKTMSFQVVGESEDLTSTQIGSNE